MGSWFFFPLGIPKQHAGRPCRLDHRWQGVLCRELTAMAKELYLADRTWLSHGVHWSVLIPLLSALPLCFLGLPPTGWLKTTEMYPLPIAETKSLKSRCYQQGCFLLGGCEGQSGLCLFPRCLVVPGNPWCSLACRHITPVSVSISTWLSSLVCVHISLFLSE